MISLINIKECIEHPEIQKLNFEAPGIVDWLEEILLTPEIARREYHFGEYNQIRIYVCLDFKTIRISKHRKPIMIFHWENDKWNIVNH